MATRSQRLQVSGVSSMDGGSTAVSPDAQGMNVPLGLVGGIGLLRWRLVVHCR